MTSPITGVVTEKVTEPGNFLQPGNEVLKIGDFSRVKVVVQVSELELAKIQVGQSVQVSLDAFAESNINWQSNTHFPSCRCYSLFIPVEVVIPNSAGKIGSGLLARVNFATQTTQRVVVSQAAIGNSRGQGEQGAGELSRQKATRPNRNTLCCTGYRR